MSLPYHKPPPYERPNWDSMNEGQKRYAMEQYNLALVRRGAYFAPPGSEETSVPAPSSTPTPEAHHNAIDDLDEIDRLLDLIEDFTAGTQQQPSETTSTGTSTTGHRHNANGTALETNMSEPMDHSSPDQSSNPKRTATDAAEGASAAKRLDFGTSGSALPGTSGNTDGMTNKGSRPEGLEASVGIRNIPRGLHTPTFTWTYSQKWKFLSFGVADVILDDPVITTPATSRWALTTSLVNIPWEYLFMYMSPAEFKRLQNFFGVFVKRARIKVFQFNPRVAFQTADTTSTQATLNQNKFTRTAIGLRSNANLYGSDRDYVFDTTEPMKPSGFEASATVNGQTFREALALRMYGQENDKDGFETIIPASVTGCELGLLRYYTVYSDKRDKIGFPMYNRFCNEYNAMDMVGKCVLEQTYNFEYAPIRPRARNYQRDTYLPGDTKLVNNVTDFVMLNGMKIEINREKTFPAGGTSKPAVQREVPVAYSYLQTGGETPTANAVNTTTFDNNVMYTKFPMEQASVYQEANRKFMDYADQPSIHVGVRAVPKLSTAVNDIEATSWLDTQNYWTVECELEVHSADPFTYPLGDVTDIAARSQMVAISEATKDGKPLLTTLDLPYQYGRKRVVTNEFVS